LTKYLATEKDYPISRPGTGDSLEQARKVADEFQTFVSRLRGEEAKDDRNYVAMAAPKVCDSARQHTNPSRSIF
jgi:hypothetical protein